MDGTVLAADSDDIYNRALHHGFNGTIHSELINSFMLNNVPKFHLIASIEKHFVDIGDWMNNSGEIFILKLNSLDNFATLCVKG